MIFYIKKARSYARLFQTDKLSTSSNLRMCLFSAAVQLVQRIEIGLGGSHHDIVSAPWAVDTLPPLARRTVTSPAHRCRW